jgi:hypothetical protein
MTLVCHVTDDVACCKSFYLSFCFKLFLVVNPAVVVCLVFFA